MPSLRLEVRDFTNWVRDIASLRQPMSVSHYVYRKWFCKFEFVLTLDKLEAIHAVGPVVIESEFNSDATTLAFDLRIPKLYVRSSYTISGAGFLFRDRSRALELSVHGGITGDIRLADSGTGSFQCQSAQLELQGFSAKWDIFPAWLERWLQRPIFRAVQAALAQAIGDLVAARRRQLAPALRSNLVLATPRQDTPDVTNDAVPRRRLARIAYRSSYCLSYGLAFPVFLLASVIPTENSMVRGLRDGASSAKSEVRRFTAWRTRKTAHSDRPRGQAELAPAAV